MSKDVGFAIAVAITGAALAAGLMVVLPARSRQDLVGISALSADQQSGLLADDRARVMVGAPGSGEAELLRWLGLSEPFDAPSFAALADETGTAGDDFAAGLDALLSISTNLPDLLASAAYLGPRSGLDLFAGGLTASGAMSLLGIAPSESIAGLGSQLPSSNGLESAVPDLSDSDTRPPASEGLDAPSLTTPPILAPGPGGGTVRPDRPPISAVPEPRTWMQLVFGFGLLGIAARRGRRQTAPLASG